jgi:hypothetical protein
LVDAAKIRPAQGSQQRWSWLRKMNVTAFHLNRGPPTSPASPSRIRSITSHSTRSWFFSLTFAAVLAIHGHGDRCGQRRRERTGPTFAVVAVWPPNDADKSFRAWDCGPNSMPMCSGIDDLRGFTAHVR